MSGGSSPGGLQSAPHRASPTLRGPRSGRSAAGCVERQRKAEIVVEAAFVNLVEQHRATRQRARGSEFGTAEDTPWVMAIRRVALPICCRDRVA